MKILRATSFSTTENSYLVYDEATKRAVLIDPGARFSAFEKTMEEESLHLQAILLTHGHYDHIAAAPFYRAQYRVPVWISKADQVLLSDPYQNCSLPLFGVRFSMEADQTFEQGQEAALGIRVIDSPGHTAGSVLLETEDVIFTGDTLFSGSIGRMDLPTGDEQAMKDSLQALFRRRKEATIYPGHGEETTLSRERRCNVYVKTWRKIG